MNSDNERIGQRIASLRAERGWTHQEAARRCRVGLMTIWRLEVERRISPSVRVLRCLADGFRVPITHFLADAEQ